MASSPDLAALEAQIATMIGQQETGNGAAGVGLHLNNPGAIKFAPDEVQYGATQAPSGFAQFPTLAQGRDAMLALIDKYVHAGSSLSSLINGWAPPSDGNVNNTARVDQLAQATGLDPQLPIAGQQAIAQAGAAGSSPGSSGNPGALSGIKGAWDSVWGINGGQGLGSKVTEDAAGLFPWGRTAAMVCGLIFLAAGLLMLSGKGKVVVQEFTKGVREGAITAATA